ncbi:hypothetical protein AB0H57_02390 [Micromonospora sp. NPDC050686]|uniref:hypothetical protein n=1 Tax=Micromonospora sp. NPDC050686 TaxID=3154631 RepID=UPI0033F957D0
MTEAGRGERTGTDGGTHEHFAPERRSYRAHFALHLTVTEGLVTRHHVYEDSLSVARAWTE